MLSLFRGRKKLDADVQSPLGALCEKCGWSMMFKQVEPRNSILSRMVSPPEPHDEVAPDLTKTKERFGVFDLAEVTPWNHSEVQAGDVVNITTPVEQWAFSALFPIHDDPKWPLVEAGPLLIRVEVKVERGEIGISVSEPTLREFIADEKRALAGDTTVLELTLNSPAPGFWLVVRNCASGGARSTVGIHSIRTFLKPSTEEIQHSAIGRNESVLAPSMPASQPAAVSRDVVWVDVGAHLGEKTFAFAEQNPNARVYAFEPNLKTAFKLMGRLSNYIVLPLAVSEVDGSARFYLNSMDAASSLLPFVPDGLAQWVGGEVLHVEATPTVPTMRLDTFLNAAGIASVDFLKIDAQGADLAVVRSLGDRLKDVVRINLEVQIAPVPLYLGGSQREDTIEFLTNAGFVLATVERQSLGQEENLTFTRCG